MPSDQDESRTVLQHVDVPEWDAPVAQVPSIVNVPLNGDEPLVDDQFHTDQFALEQLVDEPINTDDLVAPDTESDLLPWPGSPPLAGKEIGATFWRQLIPPGVPLLSGLLVFLATLPATLQGLPEHPSLLIMIPLLLVLMIVEGLLLSFAGSNDTLMTLYVVGGSIVFIGAGVFAGFGFMPALITFGVLVVVALLLARRGLRQTRVGHVDIVTSFGKYAQTLEPGLNLLLPWERVECSLNIQETTWTAPRMEVPTTRDQKVELAATISYQLMPEDAYLAAVSVKDWEGSLRNLFRGTIQSVVNELTLADIVTWTQSNYTRSSGDANSFNPAAATRWDRINNTLVRRMQDQVATWGVQINWVRIEDLTPLPNMSGGSVSPINGGSGGTTQLMKNSGGFIAAAAVAADAVPQRLTKTEVIAGPVLAATPGASKAAPAGKPPSVETLVDTYAAVREGKISSPKLILDLAQHFEALANDPVANKNINFDAARAAATLRQRAQRLQDLAENA
ncbi:MAG TPA: SPFH domain-containing protein [Ktedonobacteraceae bacterium]